MQGFCIENSTTYYFSVEAVLTVFDVLLVDVIEDFLPDVQHDDEPVNEAFLAVLEAFVVDFADSEVQDEPAREAFLAVF